MIDARIVGFAAVSPASIERGSVPNPRLRRRLPSYPLAVLRLARMGVDTRAQGLGIGTALVRHVLGLVVDQRRHRRGALALKRARLARQATSAGRSKARA